MHGRNASAAATAAVIVAITIGSSLIGCAAKKDPQAPPPPTGYSQQPAVAQPSAAEQPKPAAAPAKPAPAAPATPAAPAAPAVPAAPAAPPAPAAPAAASPASGSQTYTIKPGDNLWKIAKEVYGDSTKYTRIIEANPGLNPDNLKPGTKIVIP